MPPSDLARTALTLACLVGSALIAGTFFAFSAFVMRALARLPAPEALAAMQSINLVVLNPLFLGVFMGTAVASLAAAILALARWHHPGVAWLLAGALLYLLGTFLVTAAGNVPLNDVLAKVTPTDPAAPTVWADYLSRWTLWNHLRTLAATLAVIAFALALTQAARVTTATPMPTSNSPSR